MNMAGKLPDLLFKEKELPYRDNTQYLEKHTSLTAEMWLAWFQQIRCQLQ